MKCSLDLGPTSVNPGHSICFTMTGSQQYINSNNLFSTAITDDPRGEVGEHTSFSKKALLDTCTLTDILLEKGIRP